MFNPSIKVSLLNTWEIIVKNIRNDGNTGPKSDFVCVRELSYPYVSHKNGKKKKENRKLNKQTDNQKEKTSSAEFSTIILISVLPQHCRLLLLP